ncbi:XRE family transcriptional regulator, partial [Ruminococcus callidus]
KGLPDITLLEPLAKALHVSVPELISGTAVTNRNRTANMLKTQWYVCPLCGNVISAAGEGAFHCCGIALPPLVPEEPDESHTISVECMDGEYFVRMEHPMTKSHYLSFFAAVTSERVTLVKLYPEQEPETRLPARGRGWLYACCNRHGLFRIPLPKR